MILGCCIALGIAGLIVEIIWGHNNDIGLILVLLGGFSAMWYRIGLIEGAIKGLDNPIRLLEQRFEEHLGKHG